MGCTSSAPTMVNSSTAEKSIQSEEELSDNQSKSKDTEEIIYRVGNVSDDNIITVLPSCDTLTEHNNIFRNRSTPSLKTEKENQEDEHSVKINKTGSSHVLHEEDHPTKLEQVVEKVVELHSAENINETQPHLDRLDLTAEQSEKGQDNNDKNDLEESNVLQNSEDHSDVEQDKKADHPEEAISPSQSDSSRATRWEALADIAAELPPSLTVDPISGQIYTLSK